MAATEDCWVGWRDGGTVLSLIAEGGELRLRFRFWVSSLADCRLSLLASLLLKSFCHVLQGGQSFVIGSSSLTFLQFLIVHRIFFLGCLVVLFTLSLGVAGLEILKVGVISIVY